MQARSIWCRVAVSARAGKECWCCLLCSCRPGALVLPFMLVQTRSIVSCSLGSCGQGAVGVAFYARADQERCAMQFRLVRTRSIGVQFRLVRTRSIGVAFYARAD
ncbi:hypothetical protein ACFX19_028006 [Malus domestica]